MASDEDCTYQLKFDKDGLAEICKMLDADNALRTGCRVHKEPGACILCVNNNDCARLPIHVHCRCRPMPYLAVGD